jgi:hypothetical protein
VLVYDAIDSPLAQPRNVLGGNIIAGLVGVGVQKLRHAMEDQEDPPDTLQTLDRHAPRSLPCRLELHAGCRDLMAAGRWAAGVCCGWLYRFPCRWPFSPWT